MRPLKLYPSIDLKGRTYAGAARHAAHMCISKPHTGADIGIHVCPRAVIFFEGQQEKP